MEKLMFKAWVKAQSAKQRAKEGVRNLFASEDGGADGIIIAVIIIIIVVALGIAFREQIGKWINTLFGNATDEINSGASADYNSYVH